MSWRAKPDSSVAAMTARTGSHQSLNRSVASRFQSGLFPVDWPAAVTLVPYQDQRPWPMGKMPKLAPGPYSWT